MLTILLSLLPAARAASADTSCLPMTSWNDRARADILAGEFESAHGSLAKAEASLDCRVATASEIARFWLYTGALALLEGDATRATRSLAASRRIDAEAWDPAMGAQVEAAWRAAEWGGPVTVTVDAEARRVLLDGAKVKEWPTTWPAGQLTVQVLGASRGEVLGHKLAVLPDVSTPVVVETSLPDLPPVDRSAQLRRSAPWVVTGLASFAASAGAAFYTLGEREKAGTAPTIPEADAHHDRQMVGAWSTVGLAGAGTVFLTVGAIAW